MIEVLRKIDVLKLAGVRTILGVDITDQCARVVSLTRTGHSLNRYARDFRPAGSLTVEFRAGLSAEERGQQLKESLSSAGIISSYAVGSIRSRGVKIVTGWVPVDVQDIDEWILDNYEKLIKVPIQPELISFQYELLGQSESAREVEVTFVRKEEIKTCQQLFAAAGLDLVALAAGVRDALNTQLISGVDTTNLSFIYTDEESTTRINIEDGGRSPQLVVSADSIQSDEGNAPLIVAGSLAEKLSTDPFRPFGLPSSYTLAAGLAVKGFLLEISATNFLDSENKKAFSLNMHRSLTKRLVVGYATLLFLVLALPAVAGFVLQTQWDSIEEQMVEAGPLYKEVSKLEQQVKFLEDGLSGRDAAQVRSAVAKTMHEIAIAAPESLWLARFKVEKGSDGRSLVSLTGYTRSNEHVAEFLRRLQSGSRGVQLVRSGIAGPTDTYVPAGGRSGFTVFELRSTLQY